MDGMFDIFGYGMINPKERDKEKRGMFWKDKTNTGIDFTSIGGTGPLNQKGGQILPSNPNYPGKVNQLQKQATYKDDIRRGGTGINQQNTEQLGFLQRLSNLAGVDMDKAAAMWKDKGGFEGLMSNPAFTMGLAFMQAGANGKTLGQDALNNVVKAAGISAEFKDRIDARKQAPIQATAGDIEEVKGLLETMNIEDPSWIEKVVGKVKGENRQAMFDMAAEDIAIALQQEMARLQKANKSGTPLVFNTRRKLEILKRLQKQGKIKKKGGTFFTAATLETDVKIPSRAKGGPVRANKAYVVGEQGPEVVIPHSSGNVIANDDSQIFAMLLAANPQLQKVSKARAMKILRSRFPEYFE